jgi:hypothetical protein
VARALVAVVGSIHFDPESCHDRGRQQIHLASAHTRSKRPRCVLAWPELRRTCAWLQLVRAASTALPSGTAMPATASRRHRGQQAPLPHKRAGWGVGRSRRSRCRKVSVQNPYDPSDARYYWSAAEVGDRHLLVVLGSLSGAPHGEQRFEACHSRPDRRACSGTWTGCLTARDKQSRWLRAVAPLTRSRSNRRCSESFEVLAQPAVILGDSGEPAPRALVARGRHERGNLEASWFATAGTRSIGHRSARLSRKAQGVGCHIQATPMISW